MPGDEIASDPVAEAHHNAALESWGERLAAAGGRLCRFYQGLRMPDLGPCPAAR